MHTIHFQHKLKQNKIIPHSKRIVEDSTTYSVTKAMMYVYNVLLFVMRFYTQHHFTNSGSVMVTVFIVVQPRTQYETLPRLYFVKKYYSYSNLF